MSWNAMNELKSNWHEVGTEIELNGEEGLWTVYTHECNAGFHMCIANNQHGSIKLYHNAVEVNDLSLEDATAIRKYRNLSHSDGITEFDVFMAKCGNKDFVKPTTSFIIG